jgi:DNA (cytosine-5)-methyltransferase 1
VTSTTDLFCGAGGSGIGAAAAGIDLYLAANHSEIAIETHAANFPDTEHDHADISQVNPRRYRRTTFLWASPECTNHSGAKGRKRSAQLDLFTEPDPTAERSRATMWDVPRFADHHRYDYVIVENVVEAADWEMWPAWLYAMRCIDYSHRVVSLNSMHAPAEKAPRAPQSRDRIYVVFWQRRVPAPDLELRPPAHCGQCGKNVEAAQWWKPNRQIGRYRQQYLYRCTSCHEVVEPYALPAAAAIDWSVPGQRIGDRERPLKPATLARIKAGLVKYATYPQLVPAGGTWNLGSAPVSEPMRCRTTRETEGLLVPSFAARGTVRSTDEPMGTQTTRHDLALVVPYYGNGQAQLSDRPLPTMTTVDTAGVAFIAELRGGGSKHRPVTEPLATLTASGTHHMLVRNNGTSLEAGQMCTPMDEPMRMLTTAGHQSLVGWPAPVPTVEDCTFRMLQVPEIGAGMAFTPAYVVKGTKRQQVQQLGNAVTPPASEWLYRRCLAALESA